LGIEVKLANQEWKVYLKTIHEDAPHVWRLGWCADYPDENNWVLEMWHSTKSNNRIRWKNPQFDRLTEDAAAASDPTERQRLYSEAEKILCVDEAAIAPIYYYTRVVCTKPYVQRTYAPLGGEHYYMWKVKAH
jgi:oligopeptide transport system substrate-binding protein